MATTREQYTAKFKARVAIEAIRGEKTLNQLGSQFGLHPVQIAHRRRTFLDSADPLPAYGWWTGECAGPQAGRLPHYFARPPTGLNAPFATDRTPMRTERAR